MEVDIKPFFPEFKEHLDQNARVVFSGPFGSGKTHFIKEFFKNNEDYEAFHLFPVNYSLASNEDIFELIKYDILYELSNRVTNWKNDSQLSWYLDEEFLKEHKINFFQPAIEAIPKIGKPTIQMLKGLKKIKDKYSSFVKKKGATNELKELTSFAESMDQNIGSIYEADFYSNLIRDLIERVSQNGDKKKASILILDDLDRLDPEHIFRILNVISAHIDEKNNSNKFDFDHIIIVGDENNIRRIFEHRYGALVDFQGYFSKFMSSRVYFFNIKTLVEKKVGEFLDSIETTHAMKKDRNIEDPLFSLLKHQSPLGHLIQRLIENSVAKGHVTVRDLIQQKKRHFKQPTYNIYYNSHRKIKNSQHDILFVIDFFNWFLGSINIFKNLLQSSTSFFSIEEDSVEYYIERIIDIHLLYANSTSQQPHKEITIGNHTIAFEINNDRIHKKLRCEFKSIQYQNTSSIVNLNELLLESIILWEKNGINLNSDIYVDA
jgi:hypothetical protein